MQAEIDPDLVQQSHIVEGPLDVHPSQSAIVAHYDVEAVVLSEFGEPMVMVKNCNKIVRVKGLSRSTDVAALAVQLLMQCQFLQPARLPEVEQLLVYLQSRHHDDDGGDGGGADVLEDSSKTLQQQVEDLQEVSEVASMAELDSYVECLYDSLQAKIRGTGMLLQLARSPDKLLELFTNESLLLALARVLREDWKKSIELTCNIIYIFFCFSTFSNFHKMLAQHKIGSMCMLVLEHELKRKKTLLQDLSKKKKDSQTDISAAAAKKEYERTKKKHLQTLRKQETLLRVVLYLLLNLAEDLSLEYKMHKKGLVSRLIPLLDRDNEELLILVLSFLKKLSIFLENKDEMAAGGLIKKLNRVIPGKNEILMNVSLRLLVNLSFDPGLREEMIKAGLLPKLVSLLDDDSHRLVVLSVLYHISVSEKGRSMFAYTDCIPQVMRLILECRESYVPAETIALAVNLSCHPRSSQLMCKGPGLKLLMKRALKTRDALLFKVLRNISQHPGPTKRLFLPFLPELGQLLREEGVASSEAGEGGDGVEGEELVVEVLGLLGNLMLPEVNFEKVVSELELVPFIVEKLQDPRVKDDILLEVVVLCGTFSLDEKCAGRLVQAQLPALLITILKAKQEDDELVLQIVYVFHQLVLHQSTRLQLMQDSQVPDYLLELMNDKNKEICKLCSRTLDIMADCDPELAKKIKHERFRWHNFQWLEMMTGDTLYEEEDEEADSDYLDPRFLHTAAELYEDPELFYSMHGGGAMERATEAGRLTGSTEGYAMHSAAGGSGGFSETDGFYSGAQELYSGGHRDPTPPYPLAHDHRGDGGARMIPRSAEFGYGGAEEQDSGLYYHPHEAGSYEAERREEDTLSPQQYAMLMKSMQEPLAMYSNTLGDGTVVEPQKSEFDSLEFYQSANQGAAALEEYSEHPAFAAMSTGYRDSGQRRSNKQQPGF